MIMCKIHVKFFGRNGFLLNLLYFNVKMYEKDIYLFQV